MNFKFSKTQAEEITKLLLRIVACFMFIQAGGVKLFGWFHLLPGGIDHVPLFSQAGLGGIIETIGGTLVFLGLFTRPAAFIMSGEMAVAYWQFHAPNAVWPVVNQGQQAVLFCFIFLFFAASGAGKYSIDALLQHRKRLKAQN